MLSGAGNRKKLLREKLYSISYGKNARYFLHFVKTINLKYSMGFFCFSRFLPDGGYNNLICLINFGMKAAWRKRSLAANNSAVVVIL